ncbi:MFS transporter [Gordonibacter massiliensis]|uniref:MFS transporter n=2 Tax=Gordonibacter massiliensis (ex Traore et al. 2017) TaxID=1841863 RepID=A0A842JBF1_9ACTN|nr:MFS transporter [Gordonibacter massiliensis (ex Traore et al. 2017)]
MSSRHVLLIVTGIMLTFGCSALTFSTWTNFQPVVSEALGQYTADGSLNTAPFALYITVLYLTMTIASPIAGKLIQKMDIRIILSVSAALVGVAFILMSLYTEIWQFYISGVMLGLGEISILWLALPTLLNRWFKKNAGFFLGICMAMTGVGGAIWNGLFTSLNAGGMAYTQIYLIWGVIALVTSLPFTLFCIRSTPEEVGLAPYGAEVSDSAAPEKPRGLSASKAMKSPVFYAIFIYAGLINFLTIIAPQFPSYMRSLGAAGSVAYDVAVVGGIMSVAVMVAQAISKVAMGGFADKNARTTMIAAFVAGVAGILLVWLGVQSEIMLYAGACIYGFFFASAVVLCPIVVRQIFGTREYSEIYSRVSVFVNLMGAFGATIWAFLGSNFGYPVVFIVGLVMQVVVLLCGLYSFGKQKAIKAQWTE